ncbi:MAG: hypothetical protein KDA68_15735 [Planctomycetaceae bacterium]|nr:hypothetical protein [Planctomycetaceae bacterium]
MDRTPEKENALDAIPLKSAGKAEAEYLDRRAVREVREITPSAQHYRHKPIRNNVSLEAGPRPDWGHSPEGKGSDQKKQAEDAAKASPAWICHQFTSTGDHLKIST